MSNGAAYAPQQSYPGGSGLPPRPQPPSGYVYSAQQPQTNGYPPQPGAGYQTSAGGYQLPQRPVPNYNGMPLPEPPAEQMVFFLSPQQSDSFHRDAYFGSSLIYSVIFLQFGTFYLALPQLSLHHHPTGLRTLMLISSKSRIVHQKTCG